MNIVDIAFACHRRHCRAFPLRKDAFEPLFPEHAFAFIAAVVPLREPLLECFMNALRSHRRA
jgi:hypothetical protein